MENKKKQKSVKMGVNAKMVGLLLPVVAVVLTVILLLVYFNVSKIMLAKSEELLVSNTESTVNSVSAWINDVIATLETERDTLQFFDLSDTEEMEYIKHTAGKYEAFPAGIYLATLDGKLKHASFVPGPEYDVFEKDWYQLGLESDHFTFINTYLDEASKSYVVGASGALKDSSGKVTGVAAADIYLDAISNIVKPVQIEETGGVFLVDTGTNMVIGHRDSALVGTGLDSQTDPMYGAVSKLIKNNSLGLQTYESAGKGSIYLNLMSVPNSRWIAAAYVPEAEVMADLNTLTLNIVAIAVVSILVLFLMIFLLVRRIVIRPVREIDHVARRIADGKLDETITYKSQDEFGELSANFNKTVSRLRDYVNYIDEISMVLREIANGNLAFQLTHDYAGEFRKVKDSLQSISASLNQTLGEINRTAMEVSGSSEQLSNGAQSLSQGATEQASAVEELAATISEISEKMSKNARNAESASGQVKEVAHEADVSNQRMQDMLSAMGEIRDSSNEIGKILKTIEDIAFQTNILALNAAVEAARAGEAGKGFAVVADEVRSLAAKSGDAVKNTASLIEGALRAVEGGVGIANDTAESLRTVVDGVESVSGVIDAIYQASNEQASAVAQVNAGVEQISGVVQMNSATAEESAATSEELSGQAQLLKGLVGRFVLTSEEN